MKMNIILLMAAAILLLASCKEVSMEEQISKLYGSVDSADEINARIEKAGSLDESDLWDLFHLDSRLLGQKIRIVVPKVVG